MNKPDSDAAADSDLARVLGLGQAPKNRRRLWFGLAGAGILLAALAIYWMVRPEPVAYETSAARLGPLEVTVSATGALAPTNEVDVGAEVSGLIEEVFVDFNDRVTIRQPLARLDTDQLEAQVIQAEASLAQAKAGVIQAEATVVEAEARLARVAPLARRGNASKADLDVAEAEVKRAIASVESAKAQVKVAEARLDVERTALEKATIRSPVDGIVLNRLVEPGQTVAATFQTPLLFVLAEDLTQMEVLVDIDEADIGQVREGQTAHFTVDAFDAREFEASVQQLRNAPQEADGVVSYQAILAVDNADLALKPGMTADADILVAEAASVLQVPNAGLRFTPPDKADEAGPPPTADPDGTRRGRVWVDAGGGPEARDLVLGLTDGQWTEVLSGAVAEGDAVLTDVQADDRRGR